MFGRVYVVSDLGPGDGGKGSIIHALSCKNDISVIIKRGGAQGSHGVRTSLGESFNFSQWGSGTFNGVPTFLSEQMVISPIGLRNESEALKRFGIFDPFMMLSSDPSCICATPFHRIASQVEELLRGKNPRGTVGSGIGQAYRMCDTLGEEMTIRASELGDREILFTKLSRQVNYYWEKYVGLSSDDVLPEDTKLFNENLSLLEDDGFLPYIVDCFYDISKELRLRGLSEVLRGEGSAIVECSHGVLTDAETGLKPHVSAIRTLPKFTAEMLRNAGYDGQIIDYAVHRAYEVRHGAGPMPTYDPGFTARMLPSSHKTNNRWQGTVRAGALDFNLLCYALNASSETKFDGICLTWFDQILASGRAWPICIGYNNEPSIYESYTEFLMRAKPVVLERPIKNPIYKQELFELVNDLLIEFLGIPLKMLSVGPTEKDKLVYDLV